jgi:hypothetical protein
MSDQQAKTAPDTQGTEQPPETTACSICGAETHTDGWHNNPDGWHNRPETG